MTLAPAGPAAPPGSQRAAPESAIGAPRSPDREAPQAPRSPDREAPQAPRSIDVHWLLRFGAFAGQAATILVVHGVMGISLPLLPLGLLIAVALLSNVAAVLLSRARRLPRQALPALMTYDVLHLTALLYLTGGPFNPFSFLYLVLIAMSAVAMPARFTWSLVALSAACSAVLFLWHRPLPLPETSHTSHAEHMKIHLYGMWVAFSVAASFIVYFLMRTTRALGERDAQLQAAQRRALQKEKLASLATLAAGAAHELATPLSVIALVAKELERHLGAAGPSGTDAAVVEDVRLIRTEVERCRVVLAQMAAEAGQNPGEDLVPTRVPALLDAARSGLREGPAVVTQVSAEAQGLLLRTPARALSQALRGLLKNAQDALGASSTGGEVALRALREGEWLRIEVEDTGCGMTDEVRARAGEPFFSTKAPGRGMGLGLFLCRSLVESLGGEVELRSRPGAGTLVMVLLPLGGPAAGRRKDQDR